MENTGRVQRQCLSAPLQAHDQLMASLAAATVCRRCIHFVGLPKSADCFPTASIPTTCFIVRGRAPPLHIWYDERANRAAIAAAPEAYMAVVVLTRLHLLTLEQVAGRDVSPARTCLHQLIAGDWETIHVAAAGHRIPGMRQHWDGGKQGGSYEQRREGPRCRASEQIDEPAPLHPRQ